MLQCSTLTCSVPDPLDARCVVDVELVEVHGATLLHQIGHGRHAALGAASREVHVALWVQSRMGSIFDTIYTVGRLVIR